jgi:hypothetical protein
VVTADSPSTGLAALQGLASSGEDVALTAADLKLPGGPSGTPWLRPLAGRLTRLSALVNLRTGRTSGRIPAVEDV